MMKANSDRLTFRTRTSPVSRRVGVQVACGVAVLLALTTGTARAQRRFPVPTDSVTRLMMARLAVLSADSMEGRRAGSVGSQRARRWIIGQLTAIGVQPVGTSFEQLVKLSPRGV